MSPDSTNQPGAPDAGGIHGGAGAEPVNPGARDATPRIEEAAQVDQASAGSGLGGGDAGAGEAHSGREGFRPAGSGGQAPDGRNGGLGEAGSGATRAVHPEVRTDPAGGEQTRDGRREENPKPHGRQVAGRSQSGARITARDVASALKLTDASWGLRKRVALAAEGLGVSEDQIRGVIDRDPELRAAYGTTGSGGKLTAAPPRAPTQTEILDREDDDLPTRAGTGEKTSVELIQLVDEAERALHLKGLEAIGVNEKTLTKLRRLDGLASSTAAFIAIGLEKTHRLYYLAVVDLKTVADQIKERYLDDPNAVSNEERPYYYRNYIDAVKEFGRAYDLFLQGAAIILRIVGEQSNDKDKPTGKARLKLGRSVKQTQSVDAPP